jgi:hypothetical protein
MDRPSGDGHGALKKAVRRFHSNNRSRKKVLAACRFACKPFDMVTRLPKLRSTEKAMAIHFTKCSSRKQSLGIVLLLIAGAGLCRGQSSSSAYSNMARLEQYLMEPGAEASLARTAAPESISRDATVMVLGRHGYQTAAQGTNGFVCVVERGWMSPFDSAEFWNPKLRGPICFNPPAVRSILPLTIKRTELVLSGLPKAQIQEHLKEAMGRKELPQLEGGAMSYMMSKQAYLTDSGGHNMSHLMIYSPLTERASWGADLQGSPVLFGGQFQGAPEPITVFLIPVGKWSDGSQAPSM